MYLLMLKLCGEHRGPANAVSMLILRLALRAPVASVHSSDRNVTSSLVCFSLNAWDMCIVDPSSHGPWKLPGTMQVLCGTRWTEGGLQFLF